MAGKKRFINNLTTEMIAKELDRVKGANTVFEYDVIINKPDVKELIQIIDDLNRLYVSKCYENGNAYKTEETKNEIINIMELLISAVKELIYRSEIICNETDLIAIGIDTKKFNTLCNENKIFIKDFFNKEIKSSLSYNKFKIKHYIMTSYIKSGKMPDKFMPLYLNDEERASLRDESKNDMLNIVSALGKLSIKQPECEVEPVFIEY